MTKNNTETSHLLGCPPDRSHAHTLPRERRSRHPTMTARPRKRTRRGWRSRFAVSDDLVAHLRAIDAAESDSPEPGSAEFEQEQRTLTEKIERQWREERAEARQQAKQARDAHRETPTPSKPKAKGTGTPPRRVYLPQAARTLLVQRRREGEVPMESQVVAEVLVLLPPWEEKAYRYMRALMLNAEHPGCFYISHETLSRKLGLKLRRTKEVTKNLRAWGLIDLKRRGAGLYGTANFYAVLPLTPDRLADLRERFTRSSPRVHAHAPSRVHAHAPHRLSTKERGRAGAA